MGALNTAPSTWKLIIDGHEAPGLSGQFWIGPAPVDGYGTISAGATFEFGKALPLKVYFPESRDYKLRWRAAGFQSDEVIIRGGESKQGGSTHGSPPDLLSEAHRVEELKGTAFKET